LAEIIAKLPNAPDRHIAFIAQLIADRDALEEVFSFSYYYCLFVFVLICFDLFVCSFVFAL
jgi:hypothetical protein